MSHGSLTNFLNISDVGHVVIRFRKVLKCLMLTLLDTSVRSIASKEVTFTLHYIMPQMMSSNEEEMGAWLIIIIIIT